MHGYGDSPHAFIAEMVLRRMPSAFLSPPSKGGNSRILTDAAALPGSPDFSPFSGVESSRRSSTSRSASGSPGATARTIPQSLALSLGRMARVRARKASEAPVSDEIATAPPFSSAGGAKRDANKSSAEFITPAIISYSDFSAQCTRPGPRVRGRRRNRRLEW